MIRNVANDSTWQIGYFDPGFASGRMHLCFATVASGLHVRPVIQLDRRRYVFPATKRIPSGCCLLDDEAT